MAPPPEPFFRRIVWLTLPLGILIGIWLIVIGVILFDFFTPLYSFSTPPFQIVTPTVRELLGPFQSILLGAIIILEWKVMGLHLQRRAFRQGTEKADARAPLLLLAIGLCNLIIGCWSLISQATILPVSAVTDWVLIGGMCICVGVGLFADLRFFLRVSRNKRRGIRREQGRELLHQSRAFEGVRD